MATSSCFWIARALYGDIEQFGMRSYPLETGGMMLGYVADDGAAVVKHIIGPGPKAKHLHDRFVPDVEYQQTMLEAHHVTTNGQETYLGDWHTHPNGVSDLSRRDKKTLRNISASPEAHTARPLMAVASGGPDSWTMMAFRLESWRKRFLFVTYDITPLEVRLYD